jgi:hypothetical protein
MGINHASTERLQQGLQPNAPTDVGGADSTAGATGESPTVPNPPQRDVHGRFLRKNSIAVKTAVYADNLPAAFKELRADIDAIMQSYLVDEGERDLIDVPVRRRQQLENRARVQRRITHLDAALELRGLVDKRGKLRAQWLTMLCSLIDRARALDQLLGLQRRERDSLDSMSPEEWVAREERRRQHDDNVRDDATPDRIDE